MMNKIKFSYSEVSIRLNLDDLNERLLQQAFTHSSFVNENKNLDITDNQRLEFLGDSILNCVAANYLYNKFPEEQEGVLSDYRSQLVNSQACSEYIDQLQVEEFLLFGKGEKTNVGKGRVSIMADLFEAIIGTVFICKGFQEAENFLIPFFKIKENFLISTNSKKNVKSLVNEMIAKKYKVNPVYIIIYEQGEDHKKEFCIALHLNGEEISRGFGFSKKEAEENAAEKAVLVLEARG